MLGYNDRTFDGCIEESSLICNEGMPDGFHVGAKLGCSEGFNNGRKVGYIDGIFLMASLKDDRLELTKESLMEQMRAVTREEKSARS